MTRAAARHWREVSKQAGGAKVGGRVINTVLSTCWATSDSPTTPQAKAAIMGLTLTAGLELAGIGVTVDRVGPGAVTRLSAGVAGASQVKEPDEYDPDGFDELNPAMSSALVAWLASDDASHVSGQCIRVMRTQLHLMQGWTEAVTIDNGGRYWDAEKLGQRLSTEVFRTAPGLTLGG